MKEKKSLTKNAFYLGIGTFIAKLLGAIYRVPLTNIIGGYGLGLYQMVFPVYCLLLDFSGAGLPSALSKIISSKNDSNKGEVYLRTSIKLYSIIGLVLTLFMGVFSKQISVLQGDKNAFLSYLTLSPSILLVCLISSFRGYFQGQLNMKPTAVSQILEQIVKLILGLTLCKIFMPNVVLAVASATFSISISEVIALLFLYFIYKRKNGNNLNIRKKGFDGAKEIIKLSIPITLIGIVLPLSQVVDSFLIVNLLKKYTTSATSLYGIYSGVVLTIINLPVSICYGISTSLIPAVSGAKSIKDKEKSIKQGLILTLILSFLAFLFCFFFSKNILKILFRSLTEEQLIVSNKLLKICSSGILFLSLLQSINGILIGKGKTYSILTGMIFGAIVKVILNIILLNNPKINIFGAGVSLIACYFCSVLINLIIVIKKDKPNAVKEFTNRQNQN